MGVKPTAEGKWLRLAVGAGLILPAAAAADAALYGWARLRLQQAADSTALGAARTLHRTGKAGPLTIDVRARHRLSEPPAIEHPPLAGFHRGRRHSVRVILRAVRTPNLSAQLLGPFPMTATATAAILPTDRPGRYRLSRVE
jgi:hypothetical protein